MHARTPSGKGRRRHCRRWRVSSERVRRRPASDARTRACERAHACVHARAHACMCVRMRVRALTKACRIRSAGTEQAASNGTCCNAAHHVAMQQAMSRHTRRMRDALQCRVPRCNAGTPRCDAAADRARKSRRSSAAAAPPRSRHRTTAAFASAASRARCTCIASRPRSTRIRTGRPPAASVRGRGPWVGAGGLKSTAAAGDGPCTQRAARTRLAR